MYDTNINHTRVKDLQDLIKIREDRDHRSSRHRLKSEAEAERRNLVKSAHDRDVPDAEEPFGDFSAE